MKSTCRFILTPILLFFSLTIFGQYDTEWIVEVNPSDGSYTAVGPSLDDVYTVFSGLCTKDETNGQFVFMKTEGTLVSVDISNSQVAAETAYPGDLFGIWGFHCLQNSDTLIIVGHPMNSGNTFVALFDRYNGTELIQIGDTIADENPDPWNISFMRNAYDGSANLLYLLSDYSSILHVLDIPSGDLIHTYATSHSVEFLEVDEVNHKLYGLEQAGINMYQLLVFNADIGDFETVGDAFTTTAYGYFMPTIDSNNHLLYLNRSSVMEGSYLSTIDLNTGALISELHLIAGDPDAGLFGGPNIINAQYFNSTNQLIAMHWGADSIATSAGMISKPEIHIRVIPNPNKGQFKINLSTYSGERYGLKISNPQGKIVYENRHFHRDQSLDLNLAPGYYIATIEGVEGMFFERIPFIVESRK